MDGRRKFLLELQRDFVLLFFAIQNLLKNHGLEIVEVYDPEKIDKKRKHFTIYNAVDVDHIEQIIEDSDPQKIRNDLGLNDKSVIGVVGRLRWEKGQDILLDAMPEVIKAIPNAMLLVVGDGPDRMSLELRAKSLGLESNILWLGQMDHEEVIKLYTIMDVVVSSLTI